MFIIAKRKKSVMLLAIMMQLPVYGITETKAKVGTLVAGVLAGAIVSGSEEPALIGGFFLGSAALAYKILGGYTPSAKLKMINLELDKIPQQGYGTCWIPKGEELKPFQNHEHMFAPASLKPASNEEYDNMITSIKTRSYGNGEYSLPIAYEKLKMLYPIIEQSVDKLKLMQSDAQADGLSQLLQETSNRCANYFNDMTKLDLWIKEHPDFSAQNEKYQQSKEKSEQLKINKQIADAKTKIAEAETVAAQAKVAAAQAQQQQAGAVKSLTRLEWLKALISWLLWRK